MLGRGAKKESSTEKMLRIPDLNEHERKYVQIQQLINKSNPQLSLKVFYEILICTLICYPTLISEAMPQLWPQVFNELKNVDVILHAGDIYDYLVLDQLEKVARVYAALGTGTKDRLAEQSNVRSSS